MIWRSVKIVLLVALLAVSVADTTILARNTLYSGDEIFNLDAILNFLTRGDYTTTQFGGYPFDPVVSSGVLATWPFGIVFHTGGSLYAARLACALLQLVAVFALVYRLARHHALCPLDAGLFAASLCA